MRTRLRQRLFFFIFPKSELFCFSLRECWKMSSTIFDVRQILSSISFVCCIVKYFNFFLNITCSSITIVTVSKLTWFSRINLLNFNISFYLITIRSRIVFTQFSNKQRTAIRNVFFFQFNWIVNFL